MEGSTATMRRPESGAMRPGAWRHSARPLDAQWAACVRPGTKPGTKASELLAIASTVAPARAMELVCMLHADDSSMRRLGIPECLMGCMVTRLDRMFLFSTFVSIIGICEKFVLSKDLVSLTCCTNIFFGTKQVKHINQDLKQYISVTSLLNI